MVDWIRYHAYKVLPHMGAGISTTLNTSSFGRNVDFSYKEFWIFVYAHGANPDHPFGIIPHNYLVENTWKTLERGLIVTISCGSCVYKGTIIYISEDYDYLKFNCFAITQEFLDEYEAYETSEYEEFRRYTRNIVTQLEPTERSKGKGKNFKGKRKTTNKKKESDANCSKNNDID